MGSLVKFDAGLPLEFKYGIAVMATCSAGAGVFLILVMLTGGPGWKAAAIVLGCADIWLWLWAVFTVFRFRVWLEGTTLCVQKAFTVQRADLARAISIDVQPTERGIAYLIVRGRGGARLQARMMTAEGQLVPQRQREAVADAIASGPAADAPETREALARLGVAR